MAGTFTHWMVVDQALDKYNNLSEKHPLFPTILALNHYVSLGAVGPDYPYHTDLLEKFLQEHSWADRMHYEKTNDFVRYGIRNLLGLKGEAYNVCLAWLCGFASHLVTDSVIHPVVQAIVGPYIFNKDEHRHCEMTQDSYIFLEIKGVELRAAAPGGGYLGLLRMCSDTADTNKINPDLGEFWIQTLRACHPTATQWFQRIKPDTWHKNFLDRIDSAAGPGAIFRHIGEKEGLAYKKVGELDKGERTRFIDQIKLPGDKTGKFREDAFDKAVQAVVDVWGRLLVDIHNKTPDGCAAYIRNWDLDTGVDQDTISFWT